MGVKLSSIVQKKEVSFDELSHKRIAIDAMQCLYQFLSSIRQADGTPLMDSHGNITSHLMGIWTRFSNLINKNVKMVVVFDGEPPELKARESESRAERKADAAGKYKEAADEENIDLMLRYSKQSIFITDKMLEESKKLIEAMGLPVVEAPSEADAQMAFMNKQDDVWACGTTDYDVLLHEAPKMIANLTLSQKRRFGSGKIITIHPELIELKSVLKELNLTQDQLIVLAILVGTDYNPEGIRGVGPKKALKLVRENKDFDELFTGLNADFDWKKVFDTFKKMEVKKNYDLKWREIDVDAIKKILVEKHEFSEERIDSTLKKAEKASSMKGQKSLGEFFK